MSISFYGQMADGTSIMLDIEDPAHLNLNNANARAFLLLLGMEPGDGSVGECTVPDARRAIMRARATFDRKAGPLTREGSDTKRPGKVRVIESAMTEDYLALRLDSFETFLNVVVEKGATSIYWA